MRIKAVIFDVDGTLLDTREFIFQAYEDTLNKHGHDVPDRQLISKYIGLSLQDCYKAFAPEGDIKILCDDHHEFQLNKLHLIQPYAGLSETLNSMKRSGLKLGLYSSRKGTLIPSLEHAGIADYFQAIVQGDEVDNHKPHPEGVVKAADGLSVGYGEAVMIGDTIYDIQAGKAANVALTIGITHGFGTRADLISSNPDHIVESLAEIQNLLIR